MVGCSSIRGATPVWRECDDDFAERPRTEIKCAVTYITVVLGVAPCGLHSLEGFSGKGRSEVAVTIEREGSIDRWVSQGVEQRTRGLRRAGNIILRLFQVRQQPDHARRHIEANGITSAAQRARIFRHQYCHSAFDTRCRLKSDKRGDTVGKDRNAVRLGQTSECGEIKVVLRC